MTNEAVCWYLPGFYDTPPVYTNTYAEWLWITSTVFGGIISLSGIYIYAKRLANNQKVKDYIKDKTNTYREKTPLPPPPPYNPEWVKENEAAIKIQKVWREYKK
jgi:hypothetical protein